MAVYERDYRLWTGEPTPAWSRFLILPRHAFREIFRSKLLLAFFVLCFVYPLICAFLVYLANNLDFLKAFPDVDMSTFVSIDVGFFHWMLRIQAWLSGLLAVFIGPGLVSRDLANNGLPLILSRPFSRVEYIAGKLTVLATLVGAVAWFAPLLVFALHVNFKGMAWVGDHLQLTVGMLLGPWVWILSISLFALAMSAWVRWKAVAGFGMLFILMAGLFFGLMIGGLFNTVYGSVVDILRVEDVALASLLGGQAFSGLPTAAAWTVLALFVGFSLFLLETKLRAYQVVR
jgi:ABC-type transport system involved in multi-copper enzyme maturation permease subunit